MDNNSFNHYDTDSLIFFDDIIKFLPRILSLLDRNPDSPTYGCLDRNYWHYKTQIDFPSAIYQYGVLVLTLCYTNQFANNIYYQNKSILKYIKAGMLFWSKIQNRDGSFNEWFPNEHSYVAAAFTTYAISESFLLLKDKSEFSEDETKAITKAINRAAGWLSKNTDEIVLNHVAGSTIALHNSYLVTKDEKIKDALKHAIKILLENQDREGWFFEYGGADIGYLTVSVDFLAKYYQKTKDVTVREMLAKALDFLLYFIHPDGSAGGEYGSRNTRYIFLHGLKILSSEFESARYILDILRNNTQANPALNILYSSDDRYLIFFFLANLLQASLQSENKQGLFNRQASSNFSKIFYNSGLITVKNSNYHLICNFKKGGVIKVFKINKQPSLFYNDCGYFGSLANNEVSTQYLDSRVSAAIADNSPDSLSIEINQTFCYVDYSLPLSTFLIPFRIFNYTLGYFGVIASYLNKFLKALVTKNKKAPVFLKRKIEIKDDVIIIRDEVLRKKRIFFDKLSIHSNISTMYSPSSKYFLCSDIISRSLNGIDFSRQINKEGSFKLVIVLRFDAGGPALSITLNDKDIYESDIFDSTQ